MSQKKSPLRRKFTRVALIPCRRVHQSGPVIAPQSIVQGKQCWLGKSKQTRMDLLLSILHVSSSGDEQTPPSSPNGEMAAVRCTACGSTSNVTTTGAAYESCEMCGESNLIQNRRCQADRGTDCKFGRSPEVWTEAAMASALCRAANTHLRLKPAIKTRPRLNAITTSRRVHFAQIPPEQKTVIMFDPQVKRRQREMEINLQKERTDKLILRAQQQSRYAMEHCGGQASQMPTQSLLQSA